METSCFGRKIDAKDSAILFSKIEESLKLKGGVSDFIGSHPISLSKNNISLLLNEDYLVCEKSDGIRAILLLCNNVLFFYDRKNIFYRTRYVMKWDGICMFDGEIYKEGNIYAFAIFDTLIYNNIDKTKFGLLERLDCAMKFTSHIAKTEGLLQVSNDNEFYKFKMITKQMSKSYGFYQILDSIPNLGHENDGLIFTPLKDKYILSSRSRTLKWKPPQLNTVDFIIKKSPIFPYLYDLYVAVVGFQVRNPRNKITRENHQLRKFSTFFTQDESLVLDGKVGEFSYDPNIFTIDGLDYSVTKGGWSLYKIRTDKYSPNNMKVALGVLDSIKENIVESELRGYWKEMANNYKSRQNK